MIEQLPVAYVEALRPHAEDDYLGRRDIVDKFLVEEFGSEARRGFDRVFACGNPLSSSTKWSHQRSQRVPDIHATIHSGRPSVYLRSEGKNRPNRLGSSICRLLRVEGHGCSSPNWMP